MMSQAVMRIDDEENDWHLMNDLADANILLLIALTGVTLIINFSECVLSGH